MTAVLFASWCCWRGLPSQGQVSVQGPVYVVQRHWLLDAQGLP